MNDPKFTVKKTRKTKNTTKRGDIWYSTKWDNFAVVEYWRVRDSNLWLVVDLGHVGYCFERDPDHFAKDYVFVGRL